MNIEIRRGEGVFSSLSDHKFIDAWQALYEACGWATVFQSPGFAKVWYTTYASQYEPLLLCGTSPEGLLALLALAVERETSSLVTCGQPQGEYYCWIAAPGQEMNFLAAAFAELWREFPAGGLRFTFLPPQTPVEGLNTLKRVLLRPAPRPIRDLSHDTSGESLRKKSNRSRINRLERLGTLRFFEVKTRAELAAFIGPLALYCDFRQGAMNGTLPFRSDPHKADFFLGLMDEPGLVHATALALDDKVIAAHIGFRTRDEVCIGLLAHSPFFARYSPGKLLLLNLASKLAAEGFARLDLTPGGEYKERFQNGHDQAYILLAFARWSEYWRWRLRLALAGVLKPVIPGVLRKLGAVAGRARDFLARRSLASLFGRLLRLMRRRFYSMDELRYYSFPRRSASPVEPARHVFRVNCLEDLRLYRPFEPHDRTVQRFLGDSMDRLERGDSVYTLARDGVLLHYSWMECRTGSSPTGIGGAVDFPPRSFVLWDDYTSPQARGQGLHKASILARISSAWTEGAESIFISVFADNTPSRSNIERCGFEYYGSMFRRFRLGKAKTWWAARSSD